MAFIRSKVNTYIQDIEYVEERSRESERESERQSKSATMLKTVFTINLREKLLPGRVAIGYFDGSTPSLVAATAGDKGQWTHVTAAYISLTDTAKCVCAIAFLSVGSQHKCEQQQCAKF